MLKKFEDHCLAETEIKEGDTYDQVKLKISFSDQLLDWLGKLFDWIVAKMKDIISVGIEYRTHALLGASHLKHNRRWFLFS